MNKPLRALSGLPAWALCASWAFTPPTAYAQAPSVSNGPEATPTVSLDEAARLMDGPSLVTLHFHDVPASVAFSSLFQQTGQGWRTSSSPWSRHQFMPLKPVTEPRVTIDADKVPYWTALKMLSAKADAHPEQGPGELQDLALVSGPLPGPEAAATPFVIFPTRISRYHLLSLNEIGTSDDRFSLEFSVLGDPKLGRAGQVPFATTDMALDDHGNVLKASLEPQPRIWRMQSSPLRWDFRAPLDYPAIPGKRLSNYRASLTLICTLKTETWTVPNILQAADVSRDIGDERYTITSVIRRDNGYDVRVKIAPIQGESNPNHKEPMPNEYIRLLDAQGRGLLRQTDTPFMENNGRASYLITFVQNLNDHDEYPVGEPATLIWRLPLLVRYVTFPIAFSDLPMP